MSYNQLSGEIPYGGKMANFQADSFLGNIGLCQNKGFPTCLVPPAIFVPTPSKAKPLPISFLPFIASSGKRSHGLNAVGVSGIVIVSFLLIKTVALLYYLSNWKKKHNQTKFDLGSCGKLVIFQGASSTPSLKKFLNAIKKLRKKHVVGEGSSGIVYKLSLNESTTYAVKKLKDGLASVCKFENELQTLGMIKHRNLLRLRGYYASPTVKLLIYDFLSGGTLNNLLHEKSLSKMPVSWNDRHKIALGVARGLEYLHHNCVTSVIHQGVNSNNVLINENLEPCLSDFGLAKLIGSYNSHMSATFAGPLGYISPEYAATGKATAKADVYSFGVLLLELLSGRRPAEVSTGTSLAALFRSLWKQNRQTDILDDFFKEGAPPEALESALTVAHLCVSEAPQDRPTMNKVVLRLQEDGSDICAAKDLAKLSENEISDHDHDGFDGIFESLLEESSWDAEV